VCVKITDITFCNLIITDVACIFLLLLLLLKQLFLKVCKIEKGKDTYLAFASLVMMVIKMMIIIIITINSNQ
jgi:hypothetical protein